MSLCLDGGCRDEPDRDACWFAEWATDRDIRDAGAMSWIFCWRAPWVRKVGPGYQVPEEPQMKRNHKRRPGSWNEWDEMSVALKTEKCDGDW